MTAEENRQRLNRLRAEEAGASSGERISKGERFYGPERRRQAQLNKQRMRMEAR